MAGRLLFPGVAAATALGLALWLFDLDGAADATWAATTAVVLLSMIVDVVHTLRRHQVGVDVVALLALIGPSPWASSSPGRSSG